VIDDVLAVRELDDQVMKRLFLLVALVLAREVEGGSALALDCLNQPRDSSSST